MTTTTSPEITVVDARPVLTVDGVGTPEEPQFTGAIRALFAVRAALGGAADLALEGSYAQDGDPLRFDLDTPQGWHWRLALPAPRHATAAAVATASARFGAPVVLRSAARQQVARLLHVGPYAEEAPTIARLHAFVASSGLRQVGPHTEVYLTDPNTTAPAELRTMLQVPVA